MMHRARRRSSQLRTRGPPVRQSSYEFCAPPNFAPGVRVGIADVDVDLPGYFWVPEDADRRIRGRLTWSAYAGGELTLEGILAPGGEFAGTAATLSGRTLAGIPMVLRDSFVRRAQIAAEVTQRWRVNYAYLGTSEAEPRTDGLAVELDGLGTFTRSSGLSITGNLGPRDPVKIEWTPADPPLSVATPGRREA
jgi:hypothetical protein